MWILLKKKNTKAIPNQTSKHSPGHVTAVYIGFPCESWNLSRRLSCPPFLIF
jgi:hypothetical protein